MRWPWRREPIPTSAIEEKRLNEQLSLVSRRLKLCEDVLRSDPDNLDALFTKGAFLLKIREYRRAQQCLDRVAALDPSYPGLWHTKAVIHRRLGEGDLAEACRRRAASEAI